MRLRIWGGRSSNLFGRANLLRTSLVISGMVRRAFRTRSVSPCDGGRMVFTLLDYPGTVLILRGTAITAAECMRVRYVQVLEGRICHRRCHGAFCVQDECIHLGRVVAAEHAGVRLHGGPDAGHRLHGAACAEKPVE